MLDLGLSEDNNIIIQQIMRDEKTHKLRLQELYVANGCQKYDKTPLDFLKEV